MTRLPQKGFTIVELLIVIVVIGILAAIVIVAFTGIQQRANDTAVKSDLKNFNTKMEYVQARDSNSNYVTSGNIATIEPKFTKSAYLQAVNNLLYCRVADGSAYALLIRSKSNNIYYYSTTGGIKQYTTAWSGVGGTICDEILPGSTGSWGLQSGWAASL